MAPTFEAGDISIKALSDGILKTSIDLVNDMTRAEADALVGGSDNGSIFIPVNNFMFRRSGQTILIDAGAGDTMQATLGKLPENLRKEGVEPEDVTHIVITHLHVDHANGLVDHDGNAIYPNAEILIHEQEFDFWMGDDLATDSERIRKSRARNRFNMKPYLERTRRMHDGEEILGCSPILAAGHSPGHTCWRIGTGRDAFIAWGDLVHLSAIQISHPDINLTYDLDQDMARRSRRRILDMVASDGLLVAGAHVNAPGIGRVSRKGASFRYDAG